MVSPMMATPTNEQLAALSAQVLAQAKTKSWKIVTAESCTGGMLSMWLTHHAGSSAVFERGFVTYANDAKMELLDVPDATLKKYGAVSSEVANRMAQGALRHAGADLAVAITGIAGPGGGSENKPVGTVHFATATQAETYTENHAYTKDDRDAVRRKATLQALHLLLEAMK